MRKSLFYDFFKQHNAVFENRYEIEVPKQVSDEQSEYNLIRNTLGITDTSHMQCFCFPEEKGLNFLDSLVAGNVAKIRFGRILHTFMANKDGDVIADCYIANNDEEFILLCESIINDNEFLPFLLENGASDSDYVDYSNDYGIIGIDGYKAWTVVKELFGTDVLGLPYLSCEKYNFESEKIILFRAGKTSEFGYYLIVPKSISQKLIEQCYDIAQKNKGGLCGVEIHNALRLEGRFFNIYKEGAIVKDPLVLGLQWMIDFSKDNFCGRDAIFAKRNSGLKSKIIGIKTKDASCKLNINAPIYYNNKKVANVVASCFSYLLNAYVGLAVFPIELAFSGLEFNLDSENGNIIQTISMPPIMPKSLSVKLDEL